MAARSVSAVGGKTVRMNVCIDRDLRDAFHTYAKSQRLNPSALIRLWIEGFVYVPDSGRYLPTVGGKEEVADGEG